MNGLILEILKPKQEPRFDVLFASVMWDLDLLQWNSRSSHLWFSPPPPDDWDFIWRPGTMSRYGRYLCEEHIEFTGYALDQLNVVLPQPVAWLSYVDSSCWEFYHTETEVLQVLAAKWQWSELIRAHPSSLKDRKQSLREAGFLSILDHTHSGPAYWEPTREN